RSFHLTLSRSGVATSVDGRRGCSRPGPAGAACAPLSSCPPVPIAEAVSGLGKARQALVRIAVLNLNCAQTLLDSALDRRGSVRAHHTSDADRLKDDRCPACYQYRGRHGHDRPDPFDTLVDLLHRPAWMRDGACNEHPDLPWIGPATDVERSAMIDVCAGCLVRDECQAYAVEHVDLVGVWAGRLLDGDEQAAHSNANADADVATSAAMRRRRAVAIHPVPGAQIGT